MGCRGRRIIRSMVVLAALGIAQPALAVVDTWGADTAPYNPPTCWQPTNRATSSTIPPDGVVMLPISFIPGEGQLTIDQALSYVEVHVTDPDGVELIGTVEVVLEPAWVEMILWRPDAPLAPSTTYNVYVLLDNPRLFADLEAQGTAGSSYGCAAEELIFAFATAAESILAEPIVVETALGEREVPLETVCCDSGLAVCDGGRCTECVTSSYDYLPVMTLQFTAALPEAYVYYEISAIDGGTPRLVEQGQFQPGVEAEIREIRFDAVAESYCAEIVTTDVATGLTQSLLECVDHSQLVPMARTDVTDLPIPEQCVAPSQPDTYSDADSMFSDATVSDDPATGEVSADDGCGCAVRSRHRDPSRGWLWLGACWGMGLLLARRRRGARGPR